MLKRYILFLVFIFLVSITSLWLTINFFTPQEFPIFAPILFFTLLFTSIFTLSTLVGYYVRRFHDTETNKYFSFNISIRQGILLAIYTDISVYLMHINAFKWWILLLVLIFLVLFEFMIMIKNEGQKEHR